jgi:hypothetical protein
MKRSKPNNSSSRRRSRPERQSATQLRELQRRMARAVMRPLSGSGRMRLPRRDAARFIKPGPRLDSFERLEIYNRQYWFRLLDCLADDYPGLRALLGEARFHCLAVAYLSQCPSATFTLRDLGRRLPGFIEAQPRWTTPREAMARELARLEWSHIEAFDSEAKPPLAASDLEGRNAAEIRLRLQPHIILLRLRRPLDEYLISLRDNARRHEETSNAVTPSGRARRRRPPPPKSATVFLAVHRHGNLVYYKRLEAGQFRLLTMVQRGASLEQALRALPRAAAETPVPQWFQEWAALGWFWLAD